MQQRQHWKRPQSGAMHSTQRYARTHARNMRMQRMHASMHTHVHTRVCTHTHACACICARVYVHTHVRPHARNIHTRACVRTLTRTHGGRACLHAHARTQVKALKAQLKDCTDARQELEKELIKAQATLYLRAFCECPHARTHAHTLSMQAALQDALSRLRELQV